jgi:hypothetical protein
LNSSTANLNADIDIKSDYVIQEMKSKQAVAVLSHIAFSESNSTLLLQGWISPTNKIKMKQLGNIIHLDFRTYSFDAAKQKWFSKFYSSTKVTVKIQNMNKQGSDQQKNDQKLVLELTPYNTVNERIRIATSNDDGQWINWAMSCDKESSYAQPQKREQLHETIKNAIL